MNFTHVKSVARCTHKRRAIGDALRDYLRVQKFKPGAQLPTTHALGKRFGVSYVTMHSAMDDLVREGWVVRHQGKGTFVADRRAPKSPPRRARLVMVVPPETNTRVSGDDAVVLKIVHGCMAGAAVVGAELSILSLLSSDPSAEDVERALVRIREYDGALFIGSEFEVIMRELRRLHFPYVTITGDPKLSCDVNSDQQGAMALAVEHLLGHGYRRLAFIGQVKGYGSVKLSYIRGALKSHGIDSATLIVEPSDTIQRASTAARKLLDLTPLPEAVFVDNYDKTVAVLRALEFYRIRVPQDVAVLGYGTERNTGMNPSLSMVESPMVKMGHEAALLLDKLIRGATVSPTQRILQARLIARESCGCRQVKPKRARSAARIPS
jgi:DNA-binding LacI/PurR family transcriptional regulator